VLSALLTVSSMATAQTIAAIEGTVTDHSGRGSRV
jgi:hypothetical protein